MQGFIEKTWETLHGMPEVGTETPKTCTYLKEQLLSFGYEVEEVAEGLVGILDSGNPGPHLGLRGDTDALEFFVDNEKVNYHGCCHDCHSTMVLAAAKKISEEGIKKGKLYIVFQPGEEPSLGADKMIATGRLDDIEEMVGLHFVPAHEVPHGQVSPALYHKGQGTFFVTITGLNAHGSVPQKGINAVEAGVLAVNAVNCVRMDPNKVWSAKVTQFVADKSSDNTIPDYARLAFDVRAEANDLLDELCEKIRVAIQATVQAVGASCEIKLNLTPAPGYDEDMIQLAETVIKEELGDEAYCPPLQTSGSEDFHYFSYRKGMKTAYLAIGANVDPDIHVYQNTYDKEMMYSGVKVLCGIVRKELD